MAGVNPFLFEAPEEPVHQMEYDLAPASVNPFLMDYAPEQQMVPDNPFLSGGYEAPQPVAVGRRTSNPFAEMMDTTQMVQTQSWAANDATAYSYQPVPDPVAAAAAQLQQDIGLLQAADYAYARNLVGTLTGALDATSDKLLDRLCPSPLPQPPSPPSPVTPDLLGGFDDVVGIPKPAPVEAPAQVVPAPEPAPIKKQDSFPRKSSVDIMDLYQKQEMAAITSPPAQSQVSETLVSVAAPEAPAPVVSPPEPEPAPAPEVTQTPPRKPSEPEVPQQIIRKPSEPEIHETIRKPSEPEIRETIRKPSEPEIEKVSSPPERPKPPPVPVPPAVDRTPPPARPPPAARPPPPKLPPQPVQPAPVVVEEIQKPSYEPPPVPAPPITVAPVAPEPPRVVPMQNFNSAWDEPTKYGNTAQVEPQKPRLTTFDSFDRAFDSAPSGGAVQEAWGGDLGSVPEDSGDFGFETDDSFLAIREPPPVPQSTPASARKYDASGDDDRDESIAVVIRPKGEGFGNTIAPALAPPPKSPALSTGSAYGEEQYVPFLSAGRERDETWQETSKPAVQKQDSQESPMTPLYEEDTSQPLEDFPRVVCAHNEWEMHMRHPNKKKITGQRFWKKVFVRLVHHNDIPILQIYNTSKDKDPIQEIPLQPCYSVSDVAAQQFDQYGKIFTVKVQYIFYKERAGIRPGQISKAEKLSSKLSQFAAFAIQGDYQGVKEFGSDLKKLGLPVEHAPQISQLVKLGTQNFDEMKQFSMCIEESLFHLPVHRDRALQYKTEEIQVTVVDEYYVEQDVMGIVKRQIARVRLFLLSFLSGNAEIELGINDMRRQGSEVVGRHDIIPIATEEWIRTEAIEFSSCVQLDEFERTKTVKFKPPDACYIELLRFRVRPPKHRELPLQVKTVFTTTGHRIEIRCDILVPGFTSRKLGQIPCEDVMVRIPIPETWIYMFRVEKYFRYGSVKSAHRRSGKVKGIERFLGAVEAVENSLMEVTSGQAKYEHHHRSIVWRVSRLPKDGQGAYTTHSFFCHVTLQPHEEIPDNLTKHCYVEFTMPHTTVSHTVCRSISVPMCDDPPEKCVRNLSRHEYIVEVEHTTGVAPASYALAAAPVKEPVAPVIEEKENVYMGETVEEKKESDSDFSD